jgi:NAD-dependent dihydropyrimidine dehydrogenase PreA subunit
MAIKTIRKIVHIDEEKCNGCGACTDKCAEGALKLIDGKARLVSETYCDGLGACLGECPVGAITIEDRTADNFDEIAVEKHLHNETHAEHKMACGCPSSNVQEFAQPAESHGGCPSSRMMLFDKAAEVAAQTKTPQLSTLRHWPVQLTLVPTRAPFFQGADLLLTAHCVPFAYAGFHEDFLKNHAIAIACPKLDDVEAHLANLTQIIEDSGIKSLTVVRMEVPCCGGLVHIAREAIAASGKQIPLKEVVIGVRGEVKK